MNQEIWRKDVYVGVQCKLRGLFLDILRSWVSFGNIVPFSDSRDTYSIGSSVQGLFQCLQIDKEVCS